MSVEDALGLLQGLRGSVVAGERLARHTTLQVGGPAALFITCDTYGALRQTDAVLKACGVPWVIMGGGGSVIAADEGYPGAVITLGREFGRLTLGADGTVHVGAATYLTRVVQEAFTRGLAGVEFLVGIPGTVGGALSTNATVGDAQLGRLVDEVVTYRPGHGLVRYAGSEIDWFRRVSSIPSREIILEATLRLSPGDDAAVKREMATILARRGAYQPLRMPACDAIFMDPPDAGGASAAELVAACGLAGFSVGRARTFERNPNFIVNAGGARAADVTNVIITTLSKVRQRYGIELRPEVKFLGFPS